MDKRIPARALIECILCARCNSYATATGGGICAACALTAERDHLRAEVERLRGRGDDFRADMLAAALDRDAATARAAAAESTATGLRRALEKWVDWLDKPDVKFREPIEATRAALAASPGEHERRIKAEAIAEYIDNHGQTCDDCQHVMIDVTAAETGCASNCFAGDPEGDGSGCAWGFHHDAEQNERRIKAEALREFAKSRDIEVVGNGDWYAGIAAERTATVDDLRDTADRLEGHNATTNT